MIFRTSGFGGGYGLVESVPLRHLRLWVKSQLSQAFKAAYGNYGKAASPEAMQGSEMPWEEWK